MNFEDKVLGYLAELTQKVTGLENDLKEDISGLRAEISDLKKTVVRIENDHGKKLDALFDGYEQNTQAILELRKDVKELQSKVEKQEIQLKVIK